MLSVSSIIRRNTITSTSIYSRAATGIRICLDRSRSRSFFTFWPFISTFFT
ncbi:hypothetical protein Lalb_Chr01g0016051 [Lupinus albus]|uniref:Uncharacterized protein n=1 Tax=Lupinus albus TaxID=3870 RepID=A0A6A4R648_LUPAL|nr:hypothetical protein Lalb_Chr01g0016051 [Lupinus albus]